MELIWADEFIYIKDDFKVNVVNYINEYEDTIKDILFLGKKIENMYEKYGLVEFKLHQPLLSYSLPSKLLINNKMGFDEHKDLLNIIYINGRLYLAIISSGLSKPRLMAYIDYVDI